MAALAEIGASISETNISARDQCQHQTLILIKLSDLVACPVRSVPCIGICCSHVDECRVLQQDLRYRVPSRRRRARWNAPGRGAQTKRREAGLRVVLLASIHR